MQREGRDDVWRMLEKMMMAATHFRAHVPGKDAVSETHITVTMSDFAQSLGYTKDVHYAFFGPQNGIDKVRRQAVILHLGITFACDGYKRKKMTFRYNPPLPPLVDFVHQAEAYAPLQPPILQHVAVNIPENPDNMNNIGNQNHGPNIVDLSNREYYTYASKNNKPIHWVKIPKSNAGADGWKNFRQTLTKKLLTRIITIATGDLQAGITLLTKQLYKMNKNSVVSGIKACGGSVFNALDAVNTVALMHGAGISLNQLRYINSFMCEHNSKCAVFAGVAAIAKVKPPHVLKPVFGTVPDTNIEYWNQCPYETLVTKLKNIRDQRGAVPTGVLQGVFGNVIPVVIQGDYGGAETKFLQVVILRQEEFNKHCTQIANITAKEDPVILKRTVINTLENGITRLKEGQLLVVKWAEKFDFAVVPAKINTLDSLHPIRIHETNVLRISWDNVPDVLSGFVDFEKVDIPALYELQLIPLLPCLGGDLNFQFMLLGRRGHASSKCVRCKHLKRHWKAAASVGELFEAEAMIADHAAYCVDYEQYCAAWAVEHAQMAEGGEQVPMLTQEGYIREQVTAIDQLGIRGCDLLVRTLALDRLLLPELHIGIGIGNNIMDKVDEYVHVELDPHRYIKRKGKKIPVRGKMHHEIHAMLTRDYNITPQRHFSHQLNGPDVHRLLHRHDAVVDSIDTVMRNVDYRRGEGVRDGIELHITQFLRKIRVLLAVFEQVSDLMTLTRQLLPDELNQFETLCNKMGRLWRESFPQGNITPKMHLLESHAPAEMRKYGSMGDKSESAVERLHHTCNKDEARLAARRGFELLQGSMLKQRERSEVPAVQVALQNNRKARKRKQSPDVAANKQAKITQLSLAKTLGRNAALAIELNMH